MIQGKWYPPQSSTEHKAHLDIQGDTFYLYVGESVYLQDSIDTLKVADRLANTQRRIILEDGSVFSTYENDSIDTHFKTNSKVSHFMHGLESKLGFALVFLLVVILGSGAFFKYGLPVFSKKIAYILPEKTNTLISENTMEILDKYIFKESKISLIQQESIRKHFDEKLLPLSTLKENNFTIHFRLFTDGNVSIANAMALPSGDIILTDKFVQLCQTQDEMDSVLLHEMGHVVHRHSLQMIIQSTFVSAITMMVIGDTNALGDMSVGLSTLLLSSQYSQDFETQADTFAFDSMLLSGIDPHSFSSIMQKITATTIVKENEKALSYFSSHPSTNLRIDRANKYSQCYKQSLKKCVLEDK